MFAAPFAVMVFGCFLGFVLGISVFLTDVHDIALISSLVFGGELLRFLLSGLALV